MYKITHSQSIRLTSHIDELKNGGGRITEIRNILERALQLIGGISLDADAFSCLSKEKTISSTERIVNKNIVNAYQDLVCKQESISIQDINGLCDKNSRSLVLYYRGHQMNKSSRKLAEEIMRFVVVFVEGGYSRLFNKVYVVYRNPNKDYLPEFSKYSIFVKGDEFEVFSSLYANTIHFSDGTPNFLPGTMPILTNAPINRWNKTIRLYGRGKRCVALDREQWVHMPLAFVNLSGDILSEDTFRDNPPNPYPIVLHALRKCEDKMISIARKGNHKK